jgi:hypothetical protein
MVVIGPDLAMAASLTNHGLSMTILARLLGTENDRDEIRRRGYRRRRSAMTLAAPLT